MIGVIVISCVAISLSLYAVFTVHSKDKSFDEKMFVDDLNEQIKIMQERISGLVKEDMDEMRGEYKTGFELCIKQHEELATHVNENFVRCFENFDDIEKRVAAFEDAKR